MCSNTLIKREFGLTLMYPTYREGQIAQLDEEREILRPDVCVYMRVYILVYVHICMSVCLTCWFANVYYLRMYTLILVLPVLPVLLVLLVLLSVYLFVCLSIYLSVRLSVCLFVRLSVFLSVCSFVCLCVCEFACLCPYKYMYRHLCQFIGVSACLNASVRILLFLCVSVSIYLSIYL